MVSKTFGLFENKKYKRIACSGKILRNGHFFYGKSSPFFFFSLTLYIECYISPHQNIASESTMKFSEIYYTNISYRQPCD